MSARQGSASFTIVIGGLSALLVGAMLLSFAFYPIVGGFMNAAFWDSQTTAGSRLVTYTGGIWVFWGGIILLAILSYIWVETRQ